VRRLDLLREAVGNEPADWYPPLTGRAWPGSGGNGDFDIWEAAE
jgi:type IV secretion system protein VirB4